MRVSVELGQCCLHWSVKGLPCVSQPEVPWLFSRRTSRFMSLLRHQYIWWQGRHRGWSHARRGASGTLSHIKQGCSQAIWLWTICSSSRAHKLHEEAPTRVVRRSEKFIFNHSLATTLQQFSKLKCRSFPVLNSHFRQPNTTLLLLSDPRKLEVLPAHLKPWGWGLPTPAQPTAEALWHGCERQGRTQSQRSSSWHYIYSTQGLVWNTQTASTWSSWFVGGYRKSRAPGLQLHVRCDQDGCS